MKKSAIFIYFFIYALVLLLIVLNAKAQAQDSVFVYQDNSMVKVVNLETNPRLLPIGNIAYRLSGANFILKDGLTRQEFNIGTYDEIFDGDSTGFASNDAVITYLNGFVNSSVQVTGTSSDVAITFPLDNLANAIETITYEHHEIHGGSHYFVSGFTTLDDGDSIVFSIAAPSGDKWTHLIFEASGTSQTEFYAYEDATTTGGATLTPFNNNRNSSNTSINTLRLNPTTTTDGGGLILSSSKGKAATTPQRADSEGFVVREREIILKENTEYRFTIISRDDGNIVTYVSEWYEHTNK